MTITGITAKNFKCFLNLDLAIGQVTLLTGFNTAGKSTSLQPLLLLAQALRQGKIGRTLELNGPLVHLGTAGEVIALDATERTISLGVRTNLFHAEWMLSASDAAGQSALEVASSPANQHKRNAKLANSDAPAGAKTDSRKFRDLQERIKNLVYVSATRNGTAEVLPVPDRVIVHAEVGDSGEFAPWWYARFADEDIDPQRRHPQETALTLRRQLDAYLSDIFPGGQATAELVARTQMVRVGFRTSERSDWLRPANIGYGLTYVFPILVSVLLAKQNQVVIIDSPEAHLHPYGQSQMGRLLAKMAASGVQILVETHSDHVLNGVRLAVRSGAISRDQVIIHFFERPRGSVHQASVVSPRIDSNGALSEWPEGFFDQTEHDLTELAGLG